MMLDDTFSRVDVTVNYNKLINLIIKVEKFGIVKKWLKMNFSVMCLGHSFCAKNAHMISAKQLIWKILIITCKITLSV